MPAYLAIRFKLRAGCALCKMFAEVKKTSRGLLSSAALQTLFPSGVLASRTKINCAHSFICSFLETCQKNLFFWSSACMISLKFPLDQSEHDLARQISRSIPESEAHVVDHH